MLTAQEFNRIFRLSMEKIRAEVKKLAILNTAHEDYRVTDNYLGKMVAEICRSPIFQFGSEIDAEIEQNIMKAPQFIHDDNRLLIPFSAFRIFMPPGDEGSAYIDDKSIKLGGRVSFGIYGDEGMGGRIAMFQIRETIPNCEIGVGGEGLSMAIIRFEPSELGPKIAVDGYWDCNIVTGKVFRFNGDATPKSFRDYINEGIRTNVRWLDTFLWNLNTPATHVVRREPTTPGKSIEWIESRTRYIILDSHEVREIQEGRLHQSRQGSVTRAAHARRAHLKYLKSPRFKNKQNQWVPVKESWCGPEEWKSNDGSVTYKLVRSVKYST